MRKALLRLKDALLEPGASKTIRVRIRQIEQEYRIWYGVLALLRSKRRLELSTELTRAADRAAAESREMRISVDDLAAMEAFFGTLANTISGKYAGPPPWGRVLRSLARLAEFKPPVPRRLKREYEEAYALQQEAKAQGRIITAQELARRLMPQRYERNLESAIRSMQRGLKRVEQRRESSAGPLHVSSEHQHSQ